MRLIYEPHTRAQISGSRLHAGSSRPLTRYMRVLAPHAARSTRCSLPRHARAPHAPCTSHARAPCTCAPASPEPNLEPDRAAKYAAVAASWLVAIGEATEASYDATGFGAAYAASSVPNLEPARAVKRTGRRGPRGGWPGRRRPRQRQSRWRRRRRKRRWQSRWRRPWRHRGVVGGFS